MDRSADTAAPIADAETARPSIRDIPDLAASVADAQRGNPDAFRQPAGTSGNVLAAVSCSSRRRCTAVGYDLTTSGNTLTLAERWNGRRWRIEPTRSPGPA
jgi:hypothetical protein